MVFKLAFDPVHIVREQTIKLFEELVAARGSSWAESALEDYIGLS